MLEKPIPPKNSDSEEFRKGCGRHELLYQHCVSCGETQFPPAHHCRGCNGEQLDWRKSDGRGTIHSLTMVHRGPTPAFKADCPYALALVDLDEGFRMMLNIVGREAGSARIGDSVRIVFEERSNDIVLPQAKLAS